MKRKSVWAALVMGMAAGVMLSSTPVAATEAPLSQSYRQCSAYDGTACANPGATFRCYHLYPHEPGLCRCTSSGTWMCG